MDEVVFIQLGLCIHRTALVLLVGLAVVLFDIEGRQLRLVIRRVTGRCRRTKTAPSRPTQLPRKHSQYCVSDGGLF